MRDFGVAKWWFLNFWDEKFVENSGDVGLDGLNWADNGYVGSFWGVKNQSNVHVVVIFVLKKLTFLWFLMLF